MGFIANIKQKIREANEERKAANVRDRGARIITRRNVETAKFQARNEGEIKLAKATEGAKYERAIAKVKQSYAPRQPAYTMFGSGQTSAPVRNVKIPKGKKGKKARRKMRQVSAQNFNTGSPALANAFFGSSSMGSNSSSQKGKFNAMSGRWE